MKLNKKHIAIFFLLVFVSMKLVGLHSLWHSNHTETHVHDCKICLYANDTLDQPFILINNAPYLTGTDDLKNYSSVNSIDIRICIQKLLIDTYLSRPPPFTVHY